MVVRFQTGTRDYCLLLSSEAWPQWLLSCVTWPRTVRFLKKKKRSVSNVKAAEGSTFARSVSNLTAWSRVLLDKLTGPQLVKKFPALCGTRRFITTFKTARHLSLSWARSIQSTPPSHSWKSILILSSHLQPGLPSGLFPSGLPHHSPVRTSPLPHTCYMPRKSHSSRFDHPDNSWWGVETINLLIM